ncbi:MAG: DUF3310 domain-containing protein [Methylocella sp.]
MSEQFWKEARRSGVHNPSCWDDFRQQQKASVAGAVSGGQDWRSHPCPDPGQEPLDEDSQRIRDAINPPHYRSAGGLESIEVIEAFFLDKPYRWAPMKYLFRAGKKPGQDEVQDLRKAIWWIEREIAAIEEKRR